MPSRAVIFWPGTNGRFVRPSCDSTACSTGSGRLEGPTSSRTASPHPGNLLRTQTGLRLVDWDMIALARPERDLWWVISSDRDAVQYSQRTGWTVNQDALALYRLRWGLDDTAEFLSEIRGPHEETADTRVSWTALQETLDAIAKGWKWHKWWQNDPPY